MKKILLLLLLATFSIQAQTLQNPTYGNVKLKNNVTDNSATKVNVQSTDGTINTISKSDLVNVVEVNDVPSLPITGVAGKIYVVSNVNKIYRWNGTFYQELAVADISGKEDIANKQNSLAVDVSNTKYPTVTAVNTGLALKANLASPSLTGTPTAPTATAGTNTTQIATTAFVTGADSQNVKLTGNQTISGQKSFSLTGKIDMQTNNASPAIIATTLGSNGGSAATFINSSSSPYSSALNLQTGLSGGVGNMALDVWNQSPIGTGIFSNASNGGVSISSQSGNGDSYISNITSGGTGRNYVGRNNGIETYSVDKTGNVIGNSYIKRSTPANNILLAGGGDIAQNTAFNKNFGTTVGTVVEGNDSRILNGQTAFSWGNHAGLYPTYNGTGASGTWPISVSGNAASATSATNWGGLAQFQDADNGNSNYIMVTTGGTGVWKYRGISTFKTDLGLGSNAYTSTAYLPLSGGTVSGTITASPATLDTQLATLGQVKNQRPYKVYTALLSQTGTNAPTATALENTLGGSVAWSRIGSGVYLGELTGAFVNNKTWSSVSIGGYLSGGANSVALKRFDNNSVILITNKDTLSSDNILDLASIEIRVYN